jgi:hypothetical protein
MATEEQKRRFEEIKAEKEGRPHPQAPQGFQADRTQPKTKATKTKREAGNQLAIHGQFEQIAGCIAEQSEHRLAALTSAIVSNREQEVEKYVDILEMAESGELDVHFLVKGLQERRQQRLTAGEPPQEYNFKADGFDKRGYGIDLDVAIQTVALEPFWNKPATALPEA